MDTKKLLWSQITIALATATAIGLVAQPAFAKQKCTTITRKYGPLVTSTERTCESSSNDLKITINTNDGTNDISTAPKGRAQNKFKGFKGTSGGIAAIKDTGRKGQGVLLEGVYSVNGFKLDKNSSSIYFRNSHAALGAGVSQINNNNYFTFGVDTHNRYGYGTATKGALKAYVAGVGQGNLIFRLNSADRNRIGIGFGGEAGLAWVTPNFSGMLGGSAVLRFQNIRKEQDYIDVAVGPKLRAQIGQILTISGSADRSVARTIKGTRLDTVNGALDVNLGNVAVGAFAQYSNQVVTDPTMKAVMFDNSRAPLRKSTTTIGLHVGGTLPN